MEAAHRVVHRSGSEGAVLEVGGDMITLKGSREDGVGSLFLELVSPPGGGPPPHTDPSEELFYVLDGEFEFTLSGPAGLASVRASRGDSVVVPKRAVHTYHNAGKTNGRLLIFFREGERMQGFFEELGDPVSDPVHWTSSGPPPRERVIAACRHHGVEFAGPAPKT